MDQGKLSVASVAVDVAREVFDTFTDKVVLVIGVGKMGELTLQHLKTLRPGRIVVTNRSLERAEAAAARWGGRAVPFDRLNPALIEADLVISTTAADEPIITFDQYARVQRARRNRLALILDIAIPRDFDPRIGDLDQVMLFNVDDLRVQAEQNLRRRRKGIDPALTLIERETAACYAALRHQRLRQRGAPPARRQRRRDPPPRARRPLRVPPRPRRRRSRGDRAHGLPGPEPDAPPPPRRTPLGRLGAHPRAPSLAAQRRPSPLRPGGRLGAVKK